MFSEINRVELSSARTTWRVREPYHAMIYFAPEARDVYPAAGLWGFWMGYFALRAAPLVLRSSLMLSFLCEKPTGGICVLSLQTLVQRFILANEERNTRCRPSLRGHGSILQLPPQDGRPRQTVEDRTDLLALPPWQHLGREQSTRLMSLARSLSISIVDQGGVPMPNPMGVPRP